ncbi:putative peptide maturation dehydrogenase [Thermomonas paludicola]|uniref:putative peptide maturation dehydrogenase n=1 Tax=Thermomonas paludicola TaxID=2884874 RepID=UPI002113E35A|nr:putative peptide maturation dehydrogenase [Thermomonas paludicola]
MHVRRCAVAWLEPREVSVFQLDDLLAGGTGVVSRLAWFAHAPHLPEAIEVAAAHVPVLGALGAIDWVERASLDARVGQEAVDALLAAGLLLPRAASDADARQDEDFRAQGWYAPAAVAHMAGRWEGIDGPGSTAEQDLDSNEGLLRQHGLPPPLQPPMMSAVAGAAPAIPLPRVAQDGFDALLDARATCRNFDAGAEVPLASFAQLMARVFGARGIGRPAPGFDVIKRTSPSGGALHPTDCWLILQRVEGIAPGLYRYRIETHALEAVVANIAPPQPGDVGVRARQHEATRPWTRQELRAFARIAVAGQEFFADAPVMCVLAPNFQRNFWKYRNHAKAYRVCVLDVGHLSQTLQLCATQAGFGPFVTGAINEVDLERAFGMTGYRQSPLVVCGFGKRAATLVESEFDPNRLIWPR